MRDKQMVMLDGRWYTWDGGFGSVISSQERGVACGDVRMIEGELFYAYTVRRKGWLSAPHVCWTQPGVRADRVRELRSKFFG